MIKRLFFILAIPAFCSAIAPTKHEWIVFPNNANMGNTQYQVKLINPTASGDAIIIGCTYAGGSTISNIKDNSGGVWNVAVTSTDATNNQKMSIAYSTGVAVGVSSITVRFGGATNFAQCSGIVMNNIATGNATTSIIDGTTGGRKTGSSIGCGAINLSTAGDELLQFATSDGTLPNAMIQMTTATSNMTMFGVDSSGIFGGAYGNVSGSGVTDSTITMSTSLNSTVVACAAFKTAAGGGSPGTGIYVQQVASLNLNDPQSWGSKTSFKFDFPVPNDAGINLLAFGFHTSGGLDFTLVTSSPANVWTSTTNAVGNNHVTFAYSTAAVTAATMTITVNFNATPGPTSNAFTGNIWGISGADTTSAFDTVCSKQFTSSQTSGTLVNQPSCQTSGSNELLLALQQEDRQTVTDAAPGYSLISDSGGNYASFKFLQDGGYQHYYVASSSNVNVTWTYSFYEGGAAIGNNTGMAIVFKPPAAASTATNPRRILVVD